MSDDDYDNDEPREGRLVWKRKAQQASEEPQSAEAAETEDAEEPKQASSPVGITKAGWFNRRPRNRGK